MKKLLIFFLMTFGMELCSSALFCQIERNIELFDFSNNKSLSVNLKEDWGSQNVILTSQVDDIFDTIKICNVQEIDSIFVDLKKFLIISYRLNGGSGEHLRNTKFFTIKEGILFESLTLLTIHNSFSSDGIQQKGYNVTFTIKKSNNNYCIYLIEEEKRGQKSIFSKEIKLLLNIKSMIFYSTIVKRYKTICIDEKFIKANNDIFRVDLRKEFYVFYRNGWYQQGRKGCFYRI